VGVWFDRLRTRRWANLFVVNLRLLLGFAFLPAGLKKLLGQRFTDAHNVGAFHEFLHAFFATGLFYRFVGALQLTVAVLLMTQTFGTLGALLALPIFTAITVLCWSTGAVFTGVMTTLMLLATLLVCAWEYERFSGVLRPAFRPAVVGLPLSRGGASAPWWTSASGAPAASRCWCSTWCRARSRAASTGRAGSTWGAPSSTCSR
jgi:uncharacterized membrane protein YphA (DoxX/SURF4 family)